MMRGLCLHHSVNLPNSRGSFSSVRMPSQVAHKCSASSSSSLLQSVECVGETANRQLLSFMTLHYSCWFVYILQIVISTKLEKRRVRVFVLGSEGKLTRAAINFSNREKHALIGPLKGLGKAVKIENQRDPYQSEIWAVEEFNKFQAFSEGFKKHQKDHQDSMITVIKKTRNLLIHSFLSPLNTRFAAESEKSITYLFNQYAWQSCLKVTCHDSNLSWLSATCQLHLQLYAVVWFLQVYK